MKILPGLGRAAQGLLPHPNDVVCVTKRYCSDSVPSQQPILVIPHSFRDRLAGGFPLGARPAREVQLSRRQSWLDLASVLANQPGLTTGMLRGVRYLARVGRGDVPAPVWEDLPWHAAAHPEEELVREISSFPIVLPVATFKAQLREQPQS